MLQAVTAARLGFNRDAVARSAVGDETSSRFTRQLGVFDGRILVVDDDAAYLDTISAALEALGFEVDSVRSGEEAVQKLSVADGPPDCVLLDRQMPGIGGEVACQRIRQSSRHREVPIIMVTACDDRDAIVSALGVGADDYVMKGNAIEILAARLQVQLRRGRQHRELSRAVDMLSAVLATVPDPVLAIEPSGSISMANAAAVKMSAEPPLGRDIRDWASAIGLGAPSGAVELPAVAALRGVEVDSVEMSTHRGAADSGWHHVSARPLRAPGGAVFGALTVLRDVSGEKTAQEQLLVADRMATLGLLAASVGHEINNPLAAVCMNLETVKEELGGHLTTELAQLLDDAYLGAERIREVVADLRIFAREEKKDPAPTNVNRVVESSVRLAQTEIRYKAELSVSLGDVPMVAASPSRLGQVVLNLLVNAAQAMESRSGRKEIRVRTSFDRALGQVAIEVADTGVGILEADLRRIFSPFFTTKAQGTGLGLSICRRIVRELGGDIELSSTRGVGTTMRVLLPVGATADLRVSRAAPSESSAPRPVSLATTVLIVDDDVALLHAFGRLLSRRYTVTIEPSSPAALGRIQRGERFDAILCDVMMPTLNGLDLRREIAEVDPQQAGRLVFVTGAVTSAAIGDALAALPNRRLDKPFEFDALCEVIDGMPSR